MIHILKEISFKANITNDLDVIFKDPDIQAILFAPQITKYLQLTIKALDSNKNVFAEKPPDLPRKM